MTLTLCYLADEDTVEFDPGDDPGAVEFKATVCVSLHVLVGVAELCDQDVQQYHTAREEEAHHQDRAQGPVVTEYTYWVLYI